MIIRHKGYLLIALLFLIGLFYFFSRGEVITIRADGNLPVRRSPVLPVESLNVVYTMVPGEHAQVIACEDTKSDVVIRLQLKSGQTGYVSEGKYSLERRRVSLGLLVSKPQQIVFSCSGMFEHRSAYDNTAEKPAREGLGTSITK